MLRRKLQSSRFIRRFYSPLQFRLKPFLGVKLQNRMTLRSSVSNQYQRVTDRWTDTPPASGMCIAAFGMLRELSNEALFISKQASLFAQLINKDIISMNNIQGQAARKAHKAQYCWPPCKKILN